MTLKRLAGWAAVAFVIWFVIEQPVEAAHLVHNIGAGLSAAGKGLSTFFSSI